MEKSFLFFVCFVLFSTALNANYSPPVYSYGAQGSTVPIGGHRVPLGFWEAPPGLNLLISYILLCPCSSSRMAIKAFNCTWKLNQITTWLPCTKSSFYSMGPVRMKYLKGAYKVNKNKSMILAVKGLKFLSSVFSACLESAGDLLQSNRSYICSRYPTLSPVNA